MTLKNDICAICGQTWGWHEDNKPRHTFMRAGQDNATAQLGPSNRERNMFPHRHATRQGVTQAPKLLPGLSSDPVLRILLLRKGLITPDELNATEAEVRETKEQGGVVIVTPNSADTSGGS
jgi:hypothetical protein